MATGGDEGITAVASAPWGSALLLPITYGYIKMLGEAGLRRATEMAIVNANYMSAALASEFRTYYSGETGRVGHEMILDLTNFKKDYNIDCGDIAHRLMDYGFHAPTLSFPVHETLMVEPTESEPKAEMDRFIEERSISANAKRPSDSPTTWWSMRPTRPWRSRASGRIPTPVSRRSSRSNGCAKRSSSPMFRRSTPATETATSAAGIANKS